MQIEWLLVGLGLWWLASYFFDYEFNAIDRLYYKICADNPAEQNPRQIAILLVGGPIRLTGEMLKERNQRKK